MARYASTSKSMERLKTSRPNTTLLWVALEEIGKTLRLSKKARASGMAVLVTSVATFFRIYAMQSCVYFQ